MLDWKTIEPRDYPPHKPITTPTWIQFLVTVQQAAIDCCTDMHTLCLLSLAADSAGIRKYIDKRIAWLKGESKGTKGTGRS